MYIVLCMVLFITLVNCHVDEPSQSDVDVKFCELNKDHEDCQKENIHTHKYTKEDEDKYKEEDKEIKGEEIMDKEIKNEEIKNEEIKDEQLKDEQLKDKELKDEELKDNKLKDKEIKDEVIKDEELKDEQLKDKEIKDKEIKDKEMKDEEIKDDEYEGKERQKNILKTHYLNEKEQIFYPTHEGLARRNPVKIGHTMKVDVGGGLTVDVKTIAVKPLMFEIPNFLTDEECDHIIKRAKDPNEGGMFSSRAKGGLTPMDEFKPTGKKGKNEGWFGRFGAYDKNEDGIITAAEIISIVHARKIITMLESDVKKMFEKLETDAFEDGEITEEEFETLNTIGLEEYIDILWRNDPRFKERHSEQAWLFMEQWLDPTVHNIRERLVKLSGLTRRIIYGGEMLQVVRYEPFGHYHAHHDSETHLKYDIPCCHQYSGDVLDSVGECRLCRYVTFIMYLNDVEEGGETAFPVANNATYNEGIIRQHGNASADKYNLSHGCKRASLTVKPKKGSAILWYNHLINETTGWMGELDLFSLHGGCDVVKGEKWLSNMWIPAPYAHAKDKDSIYLNVRDYELAEKSVP